MKKRPTLMIPPIRREISTGYRISIFILLFVLFAISTGFAQGVEISGYYGYQFGGKLTAIEGDLDIIDSEVYGVTLDIDLPMKPGGQIELLYSRQDTRLELKNYPSGEKEDLFDLVVEYYQIGGLQTASLPNPMIKPFGVFTLGAIRFLPKDSAYEDEWKFAITLGFGVKIFPSDRIGIRLQGNLLMPIMTTGGGLWCGGGGCAVGISSATAIIQGNVMAGLIIKLGR